MWINEDIVRKLCQRFNEVGHAHELTFSCFNRIALLSKDQTRLWLIDAINSARHAHRFELWAYVFMPDHVHLMICPKDREYSMSAILKSIKQPVARKAINHLRGTSAEWLKNLAVKRSDGEIEYRFWEAGGGYDRNITSTETLWEMIDYIHLNPVRKGLVEMPEEWEWSSARQYKGSSGARLLVDPPAM